VHLVTACSRCGEAKTDPEEKSQFFALFRSRRENKLLL
jgi:5-methylcytosine-specific restriction endonuclease McrA